MAEKVKAHIHSLDGGWDEVTIIEEKDCNHILVQYKGKTCTAIFNYFTGSIYVDDVYGVIEN